MCWSECIDTLEQVYFPVYEISLVPQTLTSSQLASLLIPKREKYNVANTQHLLQRHVINPGIKEVEDNVAHQGIGKILYYLYMLYTVASLASRRPLITPYLLLSFL